MSETNIMAIKSPKLSRPYDPRYVIMDKETGEVLDDAQGYGYKTAPKAYAAYAYKTRDKSKDQEIMDRRKHIRAWMKEHKSFVNAMDVYAFEIAKGSWGPDDKFDSKFVAEMLKENNLEPDFTAGELLHEWKKVPPEVEERKRKRKKKKKKHIQKEDE